MLQLVGIFGLLCAIIGTVRLVRAKGQASLELQKKARSSGISVVAFASVLVFISVFGAPIAIKLSGL